MRAAEIQSGADHDLNAKVQPAVDLGFGASSLLVESHCDQMYEACFVRRTCEMKKLTKESNSSSQNVYDN